VILLSLAVSSLFNASNFSCFVMYHAIFGLMADILCDSKDQIKQYLPPEKKAPFLLSVFQNEGLHHSDLLFRWV
jgi:hypothetical protein